MRSDPNGNSPCGPAERSFEKALFTSRWLLAPFYAGLVVSLVALFVQFVRELYHLLAAMGSSTEAQTTIFILSLIDIVLIGNLVVMVVLSGYENSISRLDLRGVDRPDWLGKLDSSGLKQKVFGAIVAISAIQLLRVFMSVEKHTDRELWFSAGIHVVFVLSALALAISDRLGASRSRPVRLESREHTEA
jgi:uncharacterized protein (TIGR00645 family)